MRLMYRSGKNCSTQNCIQKAIWHICQFLTTTPSVKKSTIIMLLLTETENTFIVCLKLRWTQVIVMEWRKKNCPFECINIHLCSYMHIFHMKFFFFQHLFTYFMFFFSSVFREKKTLNENKCESHFGPVYLSCISVCVSNWERWWRIITNERIKIVDGISCAFRAIEREKKSPRWRICSQCHSHAFDSSFK